MHFRVRYPQNGVLGLPRPPLCDLEQAPFLGLSFLIWTMGMRLEVPTSGEHSVSSSDEEVGAQRG